MVGCKEKPLGLKWTNSFIKCLGIWCGPDVEGALLKNFNEKLKKLKNLLNMWSQRGLSLKGKIAVIRSIALPQMLYVASILYIPEWVIESVDELFFNFLWSNKKAHVKKEVIVKEIKSGGLKMPLFEATVVGVKCTWVKRIISGNFNRHKLAAFFVRYKGQSICNILTHKLESRYIQFLSPFYQQVASLWYEIYSKEPCTPLEVRNFQLWENKHITVNHKPVYYKTWSQNYINVIGDLLDKSGNVLSKPQLERRYPLIIKQMDYNCVVHAIPAKWLKCVKGKVVEERNMSECVILHKKCMNITDITCKDVYWEYICKIDSVPSAQNKWKKYLNCDIDWEDYYIIAFEVCRETFLQSFQYKILNRFFPCNYTLAIWYKDEDPTCVDCKEVDYLEHYFFECECVKPFWNAIQRWWYSILDFTFILSKKDVVLGIANLEDDKFIHVINLCILYAKWYIFQKKKNGENLCLLEYVKMLKDKLRIEKIACEINQETTFEKKFSYFYDLF